MPNIIKQLPSLTFRGPCSPCWVFTHFVGLEFSHHKSTTTVCFLLGRNCTFPGYYTMSVVKSCIGSASLRAHSQIPNMRFHIVIAVKILILICYQFGIIFFFCTDGRGSGYYETLAPVCQVTWDHIPEDGNFDCTNKLINVTPPYPTRSSKCLYPRVMN
jgi:hypothetical protein